MKLPKFPGSESIFSWWNPQPSFAGAGSPNPASSSSSQPKGGTFLFASGSDGSDGGGYDDDEVYFEEEPGPQQTRRSAGAQRGTDPAASGQGSGEGGGRQRTVQYQPEERYWTEYLRIALPIIGLLLMIALLWYWALQLTNDDDNGGNPIQTEPPGTTEVITVPTSTPADEPTDEPVIPPPGTTEVITVPTSTPAVDETPVEEDVPVSEDISVGGAVIVTDDGVNMRIEASILADVLTTLNAGDVLEVSAGPFEADDFFWWEVITTDNEVGYVVEDFLEVAP